MVTLVYKASIGISVSLELHTTDATHCKHISVQEVQLTSLLPAALEEGLPQLCGDLNPEGWTVRCSLLELQSCFLREVCVKIQMDGAPQDTPFSCRLGEIMVSDATSLQVPSHLVQGVCIDDVVWLRGTGSSSLSSSSLLLNATLRWCYPTNFIRFFRVYWRHLRGPHPCVPPGRLVLVGRAFSSLFRLTELAVPHPPGLLELVVEPVIRTGFLVPETHWGRRSLSYSEDVTS